MEGFIRRKEKEEKKVPGRWHRNLKRLWVGGGLADFPGRTDDALVWLEL